MEGRHWKITGCEGLTVVFECRIPLKDLSEKQGAEVLARLVSRDLSENEVVYASVRKNAKGRTDHLSVRNMSSARFGMMTNGGTTRSYTATIEGDE